MAVSLEPGTEDEGRQGGRLAPVVGGHCDETSTSRAQGEDDLEMEDVKWSRRRKCEIPVWQDEEM